MSFESAFSYVLIYVFTIFNEQHKGCLKIGMTTYKTDDKEDYALLLNPNSRLLNHAAKKRIDSYTKTLGIAYELLHTEIAERKVIKNKRTLQLEYFTDYQVHEVLKNSGIENVRFGDGGGREWFRTDLNTVKNAITAVKENRASLSASEVTTDQIPITFRPEQLDAINMTVRQFGKGNKVLWNAKMRFGKTLCTLEVIRQKQFEKTLILTHRPVVDEGWGEDFYKIFWNYYFHYLPKGTAETDVENHIKQNNSFILFASIQDLRGSQKVGGKYDKNDLLFQTNWDCVVVDEAHEGTKTSLGDDVLKEIIKEDSYGKTKQIYLSGTPFNLVDDFDEDEVYTWDYVMEQKAKSEWDSISFLDSNPYANLPKLSIYTYDIADAIPGYEDLEDKAFNFREFFRVWTGIVHIDGRVVPLDSNIGDFVHENDVKSFINLLRISDKDSNYPYSKNEYREYFRHTLWMMPGVKEARAMERLLEQDEVFNKFEIVNVAGDTPSGENPNALVRLYDEITDYPENTRTITLSCGRLTTGVTVKPWTAVLMLSGSTSTSASMYLQTIFRVQSPANINGKIKDRCFVFDFAPDRTLQMAAEAGRLSTRPGKGSDEEKMEEFLNFCPVIAIKGSEMRSYNVDSMLQQLKRFYAARVVQNGFDDVKLYNDKLLQLTEYDKKRFEELKDIVGASKAAAIKKTIVISESGLGPEEQEAAEEAARNRRAGKELTPEEKEALRKLREARDAKSKAISILRAISIRIPLLVYGAEKDFDEDITIEQFADLIDDESWKEFMPKGITKEKFNEFIEYYDKDIFIEAGNQIRRKVKAADTLAPTERVKKIAEIFATFRNPDKETVLTPWRIVNKHIGDCIGGFNFYDEDYESIIDEPRFIDYGEVTNNTLANFDASILEINSKSGLYPLYIAYSLYRHRLNQYKVESHTEKLQGQLWQDTLEENVFVICKTEMAKFITKRTLLGYKEGKINSHYFEDLINQFINKPQKVIRKIQSSNYWKKQGDEMKFDAIVGNPPYQDTHGSGGTNDASIYQYFVQAGLEINPSYLSMIIPARWFSGGRENLIKNFREEMLNCTSISKMFVHANSTEIFSTVDIRGGICYFLFDEKYTGKCDYYLINENEKIKKERYLNEFEILIRDPRVAEIVKKVWQDYQGENVSSLISGDTPFGVPTNPITSKSSPFELSELKIRPYETALLYLDNSIRKIAYIDRTKIRKNIKDIDKHKVFIPKASWSGNDPYVVGKPELGKPNSVCSQTFLYAAFDSQDIAKNFITYLETKFFRILVSASKISQDLPAKAYRFVPVLDLSKPWKDEELYAKYQLSDEEINFIEKTISDM